MNRSMICWKPALRTVNGISFSPSQRARGANPASIRTSSRSSFSASAKGLRMLRISAAMPSRKLNLPSPINLPMASTIRAPPPRRVARKTSVSVSVMVPSKSEKMCGFAIRQLSVVSDFDARGGFECELLGRRRHVLLYVREDEVGTVAIRFNDREPRHLEGVRIELDPQFIEILEMLRDHAQHFVTRYDRRFIGEFNASELAP